MKVELIDHMGSDLSVVNAARVSFDKESEWLCSNDHTHTIVECLGVPWCEECDSDQIELELYEKDQKLIKYLARHSHWTPFGHCFASFRVKAPIFVARQLGKHQVGLVWNEVSRRYVDSEPEYYVPEAWRLRAENVKQGSSDEAVWGWTAWYDSLDGYISGERVVEKVLESVEHLYRYLISNDVCPEQARMVLPQSMYTEWVWSGSLAAFARVCKLRLDPHTQKETRDVAEMIDAEMARLFPVSWKALMGDL